MKSPRAVSGQSVDRESAERRSCPPSGGVVRRAAELSAEWRSCPPSGGAVRRGGVVRRRNCPPADPFGGLADFFGGQVRESAADLGGSARSPMESATFRRTLGGP